MKGKNNLFSRLQHALDKLAQDDKDLKAKIRAYGYPQDRFMPAGFNSLVRIIIGQQISPTLFQIITFDLCYMSF